MEKINVLIPDGESEFALFAMHAFIGMPHVRVYVLSNQRWAATRFSRHCQRFIYRPLGTDNQERLETVKETAQTYNIDVLLPTGLEWIEFAGKMRSELEQILAVAPVPTPESFKIVNNKWTLAQFMQEHGVSGPPTILATLDETYEQRTRELQFPVLAKPVTAWGGDGIQYFETLAELQMATEKVGYERFRDRYIIQSLLQGYVIGLNILCREGRLLAYTMQRGFIPNTRKWAAAAAIRFIHQDGLLKVAQKLLTALHWSGFSNLDMFFDTSDNQVKILEVNSRFWGSLRGSYGAGVNFPYLACLAALNQSFPMPEYQLVRYLHPKTAIKQGIIQLFDFKHRDHFAYRETGLKYLLNDPLAEAIRALQQEIAGDHFQ